MQMRSHFGQQVFSSLSAEPEHGRAPQLYNKPHDVQMAQHTQFSESQIVPGSFMHDDASSETYFQTR